MTSRPPSASEPLSLRHDSGPLALLALIAATVSARAAGDALAYIRGDWPTMFLPIYAFLGERLRAFDIPGWNPYQFSGAPFIGDPSSGWMYLPAMLIYSLLPAEPATTLFIAFHIVLSAIAAYLLARLTGLSPAAAFVSGAAFAFPWLVPAAAGAVLMMQVTTWLPIALIGVEITRGARGDLGCLGGLALSGFALGQILAAWLGQAAYYSLLVFAGWVAWRTLATPPPAWTTRQRLAGLLGIGLGAGLIAFAFNAAALLVRLDANSRSNAAGGEYTGISGWADTKLGLPIEAIARTLVGGFSVASWQYAGAAVVALALLAPFLAWRWPPLLFWLLVPALAIVLTLPAPTLLHTLGYTLLPRFELIHSHLPDRILMVVPLAAAMLAGATTDALVRQAGNHRFWQASGVAGITMVTGAVISLQGAGGVSWGSLLCALAALGIALISVLLPAATRPTLLALALATVIFWDPVGRAMFAGWGQGAGPQRSLAGAFAGDARAFLHENGAATFLAKAVASESGRYAGYDPAVLPHPAEFGNLPPQVYRNHWLGQANWLLVHNWGTWFGVDDAQGYNPIHVRRYGEYIDALNGHRQEYHETNIFPGALTSPLLGPLNLRYLIVPGDAPERPDVADLLAAMPIVYQDEHVVILENKEAFPRAWIVHEAEEAAPEDALRLLSEGRVDPTRVALLELPPPPLEAAGASSETAEISRSGPDRLTIQVNAAAPGLLSMSEIWDPGWTATVNGAPVPVYRANYTFMAIPIAAGNQHVELHYAPPYLRLGLAISLGSALALCVLAAILARRQGRLPAPPAAPGSTCATVQTGGNAGLANAVSLVAMLAIPATLIAATFEPLESPPRAGRDERTASDESGPVSDQEQPDRRSRRERARDQEPAPVQATPNAQ